MCPIVLALNKYPKRPVKLYSGNWRHSCKHHLSVCFNKKVCRWQDSCCFFSDLNWFAEVYLGKLKADEPWTWTDFVFYSVTTFLYLIANEVIYSTNSNSAFLGAFGVIILFWCFHFFILIHSPKYFFHFRVTAVIEAWDDQVFLSLQQLPPAPSEGASESQGSWEL